MYFCISKNCSISISKASFPESGNCPLCKAELKEIGKEVLEKGSNKSSDEQQHPLLNIAKKLPFPLALVIDEYVQEENSFVKLHRLTDTSEILTRFLSTILLSDVLLQCGKFNNDLQQSLSDKIERPTFGAWKDLLIKACENLPQKKDGTHCFISNLPSYVKDDLLPSLGTGGGDVHKEIIALRNLLSHAGRIPDAQVVELTKHHQDNFENLIINLVFLTDYSLVACTDDKRLVSLIGLPHADGSFPEQIITAKNIKPERVYLIKGEKQWLDIFPLQTLCDVFHLSENTVKRIAKGVPQLYYRMNSKGYLEFTSLNDAAAFSQQSGKALLRFHEIFRLEEYRRIIENKQNIKRMSFENLLKELTNVIVGRDQHIKQVKEHLKKKDKGVLFMSGVPGVGKSAVMAQLVKDYTAGSKHYLTIPYFFRTGYAGCSKDEFLSFALLKIGTELNKSIDISLSTELKQNTFVELIQKMSNSFKKRIVFFIDGLDEIHRLDSSFVSLVFAVNMPKVIWLCAGRESDLKKVLQSGGADWIFPNGLPILDKIGIRSMLTGHLERLKYQLFERDERIANDSNRDSVSLKEVYYNNFIDVLEKRSEGLPLYVQMVIKDIRDGKWTLLDENKLPDGLISYFNQILDRLKIDSAGGVLTTIFALISWAKEPITETIIRTLLSNHHLSGTSNWENTLSKAIDYGNLMLRTANTSDNESGWTFYHDTFRSHLMKADRIAPDREWAQKSWLDWCAKWETLTEKSLRRYALRYYVRHAIEDNHLKENKAKLWKVFETTLCNPKFIKAQMKLGVNQRIIDDFYVSLQIVTEAREKELCVKLTEARLKLNPNINLSKLIEDALSRDNIDDALNAFQMAPSDIERLRLLTLFLINSFRGRLPDSIVDEFIRRSSLQIKQKFEILSDTDLFMFDLFRATALIALRKGRSSSIAVFLKICKNYELSWIIKSIAWKSDQWLPEIHGGLVEEVNAIPDRYYRANCGVEIIENLGHIIPDDPLGKVFEFVLEAPDDYDKKFVLVSLGRVLVNVPQINLTLSNLLDLHADSFDDCFIVFLHLLGTLLEKHRFMDAVQLVDSSHKHPAFFVKFLFRFWEYSYTSYMDVEKIISLLQSWEMKFIGYGSLFLQLSDIKSAHPILSEETERLKNHMLPEENDPKELMQFLFERYDALHSEDQKELNKRIQKIIPCILLNTMLEGIEHAPISIIKEIIAAEIEEDGHRNMLIKNISQIFLINQKYDSFNMIFDTRYWDDMSIDTQLDILEHSSPKSLEKLPWDTICEQYLMNMIHRKRLLNAAQTRGAFLYNKVINVLKKTAIQVLLKNNKEKIISLATFASEISDLKLSQSIIDQFTSMDVFAETIIRKGGEGLSKLFIDCECSFEDKFQKKSIEHIAARFLLNVFAENWSASETCLELLEEPMSQSEFTWQEIQQAIKGRHNLKCTETMKTKVPGIHWLATAENEFGVKLNDLSSVWLSPAARWGAGNATADFISFVHEVTQNLREFDNVPLIPFFRMISFICSTHKEELKLRLELADYLLNKGLDYKTIANAAFIMDDIPRLKSYFNNPSEWSPLLFALYAKQGILKIPKWRQWVLNGIKNPKIEMDIVEHVNLISNTIKQLAWQNFNDLSIELFDFLLNLFSTADKKGQILTFGEEGMIFGQNGKPIDPAWSVGKLLCACQIREASLYTDVSRISQAAKIYSDTVESLRTKPYLSYWIGDFFLSHAWGNLAEHLYNMQKLGIQETDIEECLRLALDAALNINESVAPNDSIRSQVLAMLAEQALLTGSKPILNELIENIEDVKDNEHRDRILLTWTHFLTKEDRIDEIINTVEKIKDNNVKIDALAKVIRIKKLPDIAEWLVESILPRIDVLIPEISQREEFAIIVGGTLGKNHELLLTSLKDVISYPNAAWVWLTLLSLENDIIAGADLHERDYSEWDTLNIDAKTKFCDILQKNKSSVPVVSIKNIIS